MKITVKITTLLKTTLMAALKLSNFGFFVKQLNFKAAILSYF